jgi:hypothetical protein
VQRLRADVSFEIFKLALLFVFDACKMVSTERNLLDLKDWLQLVPPGDISALHPLAVSIVQDTVHELVVLTRDVLWDRILRLEMCRETIRVVASTSVHRVNKILVYEIFGLGIQSPFPYRRIVNLADLVHVQNLFKGGNGGQHRYAVCEDWDDPI